ncbi:protein kinase domain-containing protein [Legionella feeleii]|uniref:Serine/threonine protein kinase n=1 Tax=Legionella feeleii TaxID=453 RepID=A0A378KJY8_9GAMM|nr:AarF/UbiB family protein [Legionella feeleii]STX88255.1 serine/threonine protein kinase [Legionella feeleii]
MSEKGSATRLMLEQLGKKRDVQNNKKPVQGIIFFETPENYAIRVSPQDLENINQAINTLSDERVIRKKNYADVPNTKYTLLKTDSGYYLIGDGRRKKEKNAYLGSGTNYGSKVKVCVKLEDCGDGHYRLSNEIYAVKKYNKVLSEMEKEIRLMKKVYGFGEVIFDKSKDKTYLIMPKIPGVELRKIDFKEITKNELKNIIINVIRELIEINNKKILHNDVNPLNIFYDKNSGRVYFTDFGSSTEVEEVDLDSDFQNLAYTVFDIIVNYLEQKLTTLDLQPHFKQEQFAESLAEKIITLVGENRAHDISSLSELIGTQLEQELGPITLSLDNESLSSLSNDEILNLMTKSIKINDEEGFNKVLSFSQDTAILNHSGNNLMQYARDNDRETMIEALVRAGVQPLPDATDSVLGLGGSVAKSYPSK